MSTSLNSNSTTPLSTLDQDGEAVYEKQLKAALEPQHSGEFVAIEPSSGRLFPWRDRNGCSGRCSQRNARQPFFPSRA